jgi:hypothetical protein
LFPPRSLGQPSKEAASLRNLVRLRDSRGAYHRFVEIESGSALARDVVKVERELGMPIELLKQIAEQLEVEVD